MTNSNGHYIDDNFDFEDRAFGEASNRLLQEFIPVGDVWMLKMAAGGWQLICDAPPRGPIHYFSAYVSRLEKRQNRTYADIEGYHLDNRLFERQDIFVGGNADNQLAELFSRGKYYYCLNRGLNRYELDYSIDLDTFFIELARKMVEEIIAKSNALFKDKPQAQDFAEIAPMPDAAPIIDPYVDRGRATIWYGDGGTGKSNLALYLAIRAASQGFKIGWIDYEEGREEWRERVDGIVEQNGIPFELGHLIYIQGLNKFSDDLAAQNLVRQYQCDAIVVDPGGKAAGDAKDDEAVNRYFASLSALGVGSLTIVHKTLNDKTRPFGSVHWQTSARQVFNVETERREDGLTLTLQDTKHYLTDTMAFDLDWESRYGLKVKLGRIPEKDKSVRLRIRELLARSSAPMSRDAIFQALLQNDATLKRDTSNQAIRRGLKDNWLIDMAGLIGLIYSTETAS